MAAKSGKKKRRKQTGYHKGSFLSVALVVAVLVGILSVRCYDLYQTNQAYAQTYSELEEEYDELLAEQEEIEAYAEYVETDEFVIETAREKLGLVFPGEIIFRASE